MLISSAFLEGYLIKSIKNLKAHILAQHVLFQEQCFLTDTPAEVPWKTNTRMFIITLFLRVKKWLKKILLNVYQ